MMQFISEWKWVSLKYFPWFSIRYWLILAKFLSSWLVHIDFLNFRSEHRIKRLPLYKQLMKFYTCVGGTELPKINTLQRFVKKKTLIWITVTEILFGEKYAVERFIKRYFYFLFTFLDKFTGLSQKGINERTGNQSGYYKHDSNKISFCTFLVIRQKSMVKC